MLSFIVRAMQRHYEDRRMEEWHKFQKQMRALQELGRKPANPFVDASGRNKKVDRK